MSFECAICLCRNNDWVKIKCGHRFCEECLEKWSTTNKLTCPLCRTPYEKYGTFEQRVATFKKWTRHDFASPSDMAANGFIFVSAHDLWKQSWVRKLFDKMPTDCTMCVSCETFVHQWVTDDSISGEHRRCAAEEGKFECKYFK